MNRWLPAAQARLARAELNLDSARYAVALLRAPFDLSASAATMLFDLPSEQVAASVETRGWMEGASLMLLPMRIEQLPPATDPIIGVVVSADEHLLLWFDEAPFLPFTPNGLPLVLSFPAEGIPL